MKEYVLDYPEPAAAPAHPLDAPESVAPPPRISWHACRPLALLIVLESIALALLYVALVGFPSSPASAEAVPVAAAVPALPMTSSAPFQEPAQNDAVAPPEAAAEIEVPPSRIVRERGRYVVELHSAGVGAALEMLTKATGATVRGSDVLLGQAARITRRITTDSPLEAWQAVFGGVVNFAASCTRAACDVRFVPSADPALAKSLPRFASGAAVEPVPTEERDDHASTAAAVSNSVIARTAPAAAAAPPAEDSTSSEN